MCSSKLNFGIFFIKCHNFNFKNGMMVMKMKYSAMLQSLQKTQTQNLVFSEIYLLKRLYQINARNWLYIYLYKDECQITGYIDNSLKLWWHFLPRVWILIEIYCSLEWVIACIFVHTMSYVRCSTKTSLEQV